MVYCVGLTGNIATGKSTAAEIFASFGIDVFSADKISKDLTINDPSIYNQIVNHFGDGIKLKDGQLDRRSLRDIIFSNSDERLWLEALLHPAIRHELKKKVALSTSPYCIVEIPLLIDKKAYPYLNAIVVVNSSLENQVSRVTARDHCSKEQALAVITAQPDFNLRLKQADYVLMNDSGYSELKHAIEDLHQLFITQAQDHNTK